MSVMIRVGKRRYARRQMPTEVMRALTEEIWHEDCPDDAQRHRDDAARVLEAMPDWLLTDTIAAATTLRQRAEELQQARAARQQSA